MSLSEPAHSRNNASHAGAYAESVYALNATGGFTMERGFDTIELAAQTAPVHVDVTDAVQVTMAVATFSDKLGAFTTATDSFANDSITLSAAELKAGLTANSVISVGKYSTLYSDFQTYVAAYFGFNGGFESLFTAASEFAIDTNNTFAAASFIALLNGDSEVAAAGNYVNELTGSITIANIGEILKYAVDSNVFGNRDPATQNWGLGDKFVAGDLIWVPAGTQITLNLAIDSEALAPLNNLSAATSSSGAGTNFAESTVATTTLITRVSHAPLLIKLV
jgi:hypothetical protein